VYLNLKKENGELNDMSQGPLKKHVRYFVVSVSREIKRKLELLRGVDMCLNLPEDETMAYYEEVVEKHMDHVGFC